MCLCLSQYLLANSNFLKFLLTFCFFIQCGFSQFAEWVPLIQFSFNCLKMISLSLVFSRFLVSLSFLNYILIIIVCQGQNLGKSLQLMQ